MATQKDFRIAWILLLLRNGSSYGYELRRQLGLRALKLDPAVMYRTLRELEGAGFISSCWMASDAGPRRHVYDITDPGRNALARYATAIRVARNAQNTFLGAYDEPGAAGS